MQRIAFVRVISFVTLCFVANGNAWLLVKSAFPNVHIASQTHHPGSAVKENGRFFQLPLLRQAIPLILNVITFQIFCDRVVSFSQEYH